VGVTGPTHTRDGAPDDPKTMTNQRPKLAHLRSFLYVARAHSISRASTSLGISQPTITEHIQKLEEGYGRKLFDRGPNGAALTAAGEALRRMVEPHLDQLDSLTFDEKPMQGYVGLGGPPDLLSLRVLPTLKPLYEKGIFIRVRPGVAADLLEHLENRTVDVFIATARLTSRLLEVRYEPLFEEEYVLVGDARWRARIDKQLDPRESTQENERRLAEVLACARFFAFDGELPLIRDHPLILKHFGTIFGSDKLRQVPLIMPDLRALRDVAIAGAGVTVIPRYIAQDALERGELFELYQPPNRKYNTLYIAHRAEPLTPVQRRLMECLQESAGEWEDKPA